MKKLFHKNEDGQAMVEFALVLPIFLLILCGVIDFGWLFYNQLALNNICREGARYAVVNTESGEADIMKHIDNYIESTYAIGDVDVKLTYSKPLDPVGGDLIVSAEKEFKYLTPVISTVTGKATRPIVAEVIMKVES